MVAFSIARVQRWGDRRYKQAAAFGERASQQLLLEPMIRERIASAYHGTVSVADDSLNKP
jgi:hypothetical protein